MAKERKMLIQATDPLEASKISVKPQPAPEPPPIVAPPPPVAAAPVVEATTKPTGPLKQYRVAETTTISLQGQLCRLNRDDIVSEASYGPLGMKRILESNVALVEIKE